MGTPSFLILEFLYCYFTWILRRYTFVRSKLFMETVNASFVFAKIDAPILDPPCSSIKIGHPMCRCHTGQSVKHFHVFDLIENGSLIRC